MRTTYNKLIRDQIINIINETGKNCRVRILEENEYKSELLKKVHEELEEYMHSGNDQEAIEELADLIEVIRALSKVHGSSPEELEQVRREKAEQRGGFQEKLFLLDVEE